MLPAVDSLIRPVLVREWTRQLAGRRFELETGVLQVVAVHAAASGVSRVIKIGEETPKSRGDRMCLEVARRWADVIVLTGEILRSEPALNYEWWSPTAEVGRALDGWRAETGHERAQSPWLVVMTRGSRLPPEHPVLRNPRTVICVPKDAEVDSGVSHVPVLRLPADDGRTVLDVCRSQLGAQRISIEAGPRTSVPFYEDPCCVDTLLCSTYGGPLAPALLSEDFVSRAALTQRGRFLSEAQRVAGEDRQWTHALWARNS